MSNFLDSSHRLWFNGAVIGQYDVASFETSPLAEHPITILGDQSADCDLRCLKVGAVRFFSFTTLLSHPGIMSSRKLLQRSFVWPDMRRDIIKWAQEYQQCARAEIVRHNVAPFETVTHP